jgi:trehalose 6-phosphate synthase
MDVELDSKTDWVNEGDQDCRHHLQDLILERRLIIASNRGPITFTRNEQGELQYQRGSGGLVTALTGVAQQAETRWIACAQTEEDRSWGEGQIPSDGSEERVWMKFIAPAASEYEGYYGVIANPLLWFLQHSMWDIFREPTIDRTVWDHWDHGYVPVNMQFAQAVAQEIVSAPDRPLVMFQDYHLYLAPHFVRYTLRPKAKYTLAHFIHIPWPGADEWGFLPGKMRHAILEGLAAVDMLGVQTREDGLNFLRTCESYLPGAHISFQHGRLWYRNHATYVRDFPISIDVQGLRTLARNKEVKEYRDQLLERHGGQQIIMRTDRIEPSKNIVRGFQAFDQMLELHPEHRGRVKFLAMLVPSRMEVEKYGSYLDELMGAAGRVNAKYGDMEWEPIRIFVSDNYPRAVAALQIYNVLLVNSIADGMNLVAKEGPTVNQCDGVLVLSERTGAFQQLADGALVVSPLDIHGTAEAMHQALTMPLEDRRSMSERLRATIEREDIGNWLCQQLRTIVELNL